MAPGVPAALRKLLPTVLVAAVVLAAALWQHHAVATGTRALLAADPRWLAVAAVATIALWPAQVWMMRGSIPAHTPAHKLFALQLAVPAIGLVPAASLLVRLRFLRRTGLTHTAALASMTLFGFAALMVRVPMVIVAAIAAPALMSRSGASPPWHDLGARTAGWWHAAADHPWRTAGVVLAAFAILCAVATVGVITLRHKAAERGGWREMIFHHGRAEARFAWKSLATTAIRPQRAALLWLCAVAEPLLMVVALWAMLHAVGANLSLADTFVVQLVTVALAPLLPTPSGAGARELTIAAGLTAVAGLTGGIAVAAALGFRLLTFWCQIPLGLASFAYLSHRRDI
ncbi:YbhN family protein [Nocardia sp. NPDC088792]|uniref:lysylphosphatidylglycerol synthase transmembrane domain-containing protein n=1 Tax=Nocardia sp. NPDC088792 TaxID=3364332 RepID=UPI00381AB975